MFTKGFYIAFIFLVSLVFQPNEALACCKHETAQLAIETSVNSHSCCEMNAAPNENNCCCTSDSEDGDCSGNCGGTNCQCVASVFFLSEPASIEMRFISNTTLIRYVWSYFSIETSITFNAIWQPPQFS